MNISINVLFFFFSPLLPIVGMRHRKVSFDVTEKIAHLNISNCAASDKKSINNRVDVG